MNKIVSLFVVSIFSINCTLIIITKQMTRVASQFTFCSPEHILPRMVVEQDEQNLVTRLFSLDGNQVESAQTLFFDGILSGEIVSVKKNISPTEIAQLVMKYNYVDVTDRLPANDIISTGKPLLLDFGTTSSYEINYQFERLAPALSAFSVFEIIAACVYYPLLLLGQPAILSEKCRTKLMLWENVDLLNKRITEHTRIRQMN